MAVRPRRKSWGCGSVQQLQPTFKAALVRPVGIGLGYSRGFSSPRPRPSAEERLATHTPIRENDVDHSWAYCGPAFQLTVEKSPVCVAQP